MCNICDDYQVVNVMLAISGSGQYVFSRVLLGKLTTRANTAQVARASQRSLTPNLGSESVSGVLNPKLGSESVLLRRGTCAKAS